MLRILSFLMLFSEIEMYYTPNNRAVTLTFNDLVINESKNGKNEVNKGKIYSFVDREDVKFTCNAYNLTSQHWVLYLKEGENILESYCSHRGEMNGEVAKNITLTANMSGSHYKCELNIGSQLNISINNSLTACSVNEEHLAATTSIVMKVVLRVAKLNIFVNKRKLKKNNIGTEVVYKYANNEKFEAMCINDDAANGTEWLPPASYLIVLHEQKLSALLVSYNRTGLTAKENGSYFDCVKKYNTSNGISRTSIQKSPSHRLRLILIEGILRPARRQHTLVLRQLGKTRRLSILLCRLPNCTTDNEKKPTCPKDLEADTCKKQDLCITGYDESKVTKTDHLITYRHNNTNQTIKLHCHRKSMSRNDAYIQWTGPLIRSNKTNCKSQIIFVKLTTNSNRRVFTCEGGNNNETFMPVSIEFVYVDPKVEKPLENLKENRHINIGNNKDMGGPFKTEHWILIAIGIICLLCSIIVAVKRYKIWKMRKSRKQDKVDLNPDNSRSDVPEYYADIQSQPKLSETYTVPKSDDINADIYCEPYSAMYLQPLPKGIRIKMNSENHSKIHNNDSVTCNDCKTMNYVSLLNDYTTANYMNVKQAKDVNSHQNVYDVAT